MRKCLDLDVFTIPDPEENPSTSEVKDVAEEVIAPLPLPGVEGIVVHRRIGWLTRHASVRVVLSYRISESVHPEVC
jgi:hypothetical protein